MREFKHSEIIYFVSRNCMYGCDRDGLQRFANNGSSFIGRLVVVGV